jgi:spore germination protein YaaH
MKHVSAMVVAGVLLSACAKHPPAVIEDRSVKRVDVAPEVRQATSNERQAMPSQPTVFDTGLSQGPDYRVQQGDTLYSVAFRLGMDYRTLAEFNEIEPPFTILVGELLQDGSDCVAAEAAGRQCGINAGNKAGNKAGHHGGHAAETGTKANHRSGHTRGRKKAGDREPRCEQADKRPSQSMAVAGNRHREPSVCW